MRLGLRHTAVLALVFGLAISLGCGRKKYENPITKDTLQPDKVLFDKAIKDIEKGRFDVARLTLQTLISTYDTSEFLAKAKLAVADSWFREGGSHGMAQAEAEYKDFILFYPTLEESAEAQEKVCMIHVRQMEKADRDTLHALRAEDECRQVLVQFPNSKFAPRAEQLLRNIQEVIAEHEYRVGSFYHHKGSYPSAANRLQAIADQYPLFSKADDALSQLGDSYSRMGNRFRDRTIDSYTRLARDYPLSPLAEDAKKKLKSLEAPIPQPDPVALARMKYEIENYDKPGMMSHVWGVFKKGPDTSGAAKSGTPAMTALRPMIPASVPSAASGAAGAAPTADVSVSAISGDASALDTKPDARKSPPAQPPPAAEPAKAIPPATAPAAASPDQPLPTNHPAAQTKVKKKKAGKKKTKTQEQAPPQPQ